MRYLRTNTATRVTVGPFSDATDGVTPETGLTVTSEKLTLMVDTGGVPTLVLDAMATASGGANDMVHVTGDDAAFYDLELAAANLNYLGRAMLAITDTATHCPVFHEFMIIPAMMYDALVLGTDRLDANVTHVGDTVQTAGDLSGQLTTVAGYVDTEVLPASIRTAMGLATNNLDTQLTAISAKTANIPTDPADASDIATLIGNVQAALTTLTTRLGTPLVSTIAGELHDVNLAIQASSPTDIADAVLAAATAAPIAANVEKINDVALIGAGTAIDPWGP